MPAATEHLVIAGFGMASTKLLRELKAGGYHGAITVIGDEGDRSYNRIHLSSVAAGLTVPDEELWLADEAWCRSQGIELVSGRRAEHIDTDGKTLTLSGGRKIAWNKLVIATGARAFLPPLEGLDLAGVHVLRTLEDAAAIRSQIRHGSRVAVLGGGVLGVEVADRLLSAGCTVHIVHQAAWPMESQLDDEAGRFLGACLGKQGMDLRLAQTATRCVGQNGRVRALELSDGGRIDVDMIIVSCGIKVDTTLAQTAALKTARGIVVDEKLETSVPGIFAIGDCAESEGRVWGLISPSYAMATVLARHLTGNKAGFANPSSVSLRLNAKIPVLVVGHASGTPEHTRFSDPAKGVYRRVAIRDGKIGHAVCIGDEQGFDEIEYFAENVFEDSAARLIVPKEQRESPVNPATWPEKLIVCHCNNVSVGDLRQVLSTGPRTLSQLSAATHAGSGCGSCRSKLKLFIQNDGTSATGLRQKIADIDIRGYSLVGFLSNILNYIMFFGFAISLVTGVLKFPGFLAWIGISLRKMPMPEIMVLHDWGSLAFGGAAILHLVLHTRQMIRFVADLFRKPKK